MKLEQVVMPFFPLKHEALCEAQARLTLQQVVAWGLETCPHDDGEGTLCYRHACGQCWAELREQVK
jgi:hypothetical protein